MSNVIKMKTARCVMAASGKTGTVDIYGTIGKDWWSNEGVDPAEFKQELDALGDIDTLEVRIHSYGGYVYEGMAIITALRKHKAQKHVFVDGMAASMASVILMVGDKRYMARNATVMIHDPLSICVGNLTDMRKAAEQLEQVKEQLLDLYAERASITRDQISDLMTAETYMTADQALEMGFVDVIGDEIESDPAQHASAWDQPFRIAATAQPDFNKLAPFLALPTSGNPETPEEVPTMTTATPGAAPVPEAQTTDQILAAERQRVLAIREMSQPGVENLIDGFITDGTSAGDAAIAINKKLKEQAAASAHLSQRRAGSNAPVLDDGSAGDGSAIQADDYAAQWDANVNNCKAEFLSKDAYVAFKSHQAKGLVKIQSRA